MYPQYRIIVVDLHYVNSPNTSEKTEFKVDDYELLFSPRTYPLSSVNLRDSHIWIRDTEDLIC